MNNEPELEEEFEEDEDGEFEMEAAEVLEEIRDEISLHSELLEKLVSVQEAKLIQDKAFYNQLIAALEKIASKA